MADEMIEARDALSGQHDRALAVAASSSAASSTGGEGTDLAIWTALAHFYKGDLAGAEAGYHRAAKLARAIPDAAREANAVNGLGLVAQRRGLFDAARQAYEKALELAEFAGDRARVGGCHLNLGTVLQELGRTREAAQSFRRSATVARLIGAQVQSARARSNLANLLLLVGRLDESRLAAEEARDLAALAGAGVVRAYSILLLGEAALVAGKLADAAMRLSEARDAFAALGNASEAIEAETLIARIRLQQGELPDALAAATDLAARARAKGLALHEAKALWVASLALSPEDGRGSIEAFSQSLRALGLAMPTGRLELVWLIEAAASRSAVDDELRRAFATRASRTLEEARAKVDPEDRESWVNRPDRAFARTLLPGRLAP